VIHRVNSSLYGNALYASVHTQGIDNVNRISRELKVGTVAINCDGNHMAAPNLPFGGFKSDGIGREGGLESMYEYTEIKVITMPTTRV
jgi:acyl-CoA reductase-like NAD-dependent aldehyde dehydrogenase